MTNTIVITGAGAITPIGIGVDEYWKELVAGTCGITDITRINTKDIPVHCAAEVKGFNPKDYLPTKLAMDLEPYMQYAYVAGLEAVKQSGLDTNSDRVGVVMGSALAGIDIIGRMESRYVEKGRQAEPKFLLKAMGNIAAAQFAINHGITGPSMTVTTACSSGGDAITLAASMIRSGMADAMVVLAGEAAITSTMVQSLCKVGALSKTGQSLPFDEERNGFVIGEGGGALVLERADVARVRGAKPLARLLGCANNNDAYNPVSPHPDGVGAAKCMELALKDAGIAPEQIGYINAHGTATSQGDIAECKAVKKVFGDHDVLVGSTKGATGHMMGAGGVLETIACIKAIETDCIPASIGMTKQDPLCEAHIPTAPVKGGGIKVAMSNAFGFGGQNSSIIVGALD